MKVLCLFLVALFCITSVVFAGNELSTYVEAIPAIYARTPPGTASLNASRWPHFDSCIGSCEVDCMDMLAALSNSTTKIGNYRNDTTYEHDSKGYPEFVPIVNDRKEPDLEASGPIPVDYRKNGSILITWTLRVEGLKVLVSPYTEVCCPRGAGSPSCKNFHGDITEEFKGGSVYSQAYIDLGSGFKAIGVPSVMTIPDAGILVGHYPNDPTLSGSCLIKASDIAGGFPPTISVKIYWKNDTSQKIISQPDYRNIVITIFPADK